MTPGEEWDGVILEPGVYCFKEILVFDVEGRWKDVVRLAFRADDD